MHGTRFLATLLIILSVMLLGDAYGDVEVVSPEVIVREGDRIVEIEWRDPEPQKMTRIHQPQLGTPQQPWRGAKIESGGEYLGACDWNFVFGTKIIGDVAKLSYKEVADWKKKSLKPDQTEIEIPDLDTWYDLSYGIKLRVLSEGLFEVDTTGWSGASPLFGGVYVGDSTGFTFRCTSGGDIGSGDVTFEWEDDLGNSGSFEVSAAQSWIFLRRGLKIKFQSGRCNQGESFRVKVRPAVVLGDIFSISVETFDGYLVLRRSVEDRQFKVINNISKCDSFEFFCDADGNPDPGGVRRYVDEGVWMEGEGYSKDPRFKTVLNGFPYDYTVVTYDWTSARRLAMSDTTNAWYRVVPSSPPGRSVDDVIVVPNPYIKHAAWEMGEAKVQFFNVPEDARIRIYDAVGGYITTIYPKEYSFGGQQGRAEWNLKNGKNEDVASGVYIYRIESKSGNRLGRFVIVR